MLNWFVSLWHIGQLENSLGSWVFLVIVSRLFDTARLCEMRVRMWFNGGDDPRTGADVFSSRRASATPVHRGSPTADTASASTYRSHSGLTPPLRRIAASAFPLVRSCTPTTVVATVKSKIGIKHRTGAPGRRYVTNRSVCISDRVVMAASTAAAAAAILWCSRPGCLQTPTLASAERRV